MDVYHWQVYYLEATILPLSREQQSDIVYLSIYDSSKYAQKYKMSLYIDIRPNRIKTRPLLHYVKAGLVAPLFPPLTPFLPLLGLRLW